MIVQKCYKNNESWKSLEKSVRFSEVENHYRQVQRRLQDQWNNLQKPYQFSTSKTSGALTSDKIVAGLGDSDTVSPRKPARSIAAVWFDSVKFDYISLGRYNTTSIQKQSAKYLLLYFRLYPYFYNPTSTPRKASKIVTLDVCLTWPVGQFVTGLFSPGRSESTEMRVKRGIS